MRKHVVGAVLVAVVVLDVCSAGLSTSHHFLADMTCTVENGIDYMGNDICNTPGASAEACCSKCSATTGCGAFTWSAYKGGTCWLKSRKGNAILNANTRSGVTAPSSSGSCTIESGVDYVGNDIGNAPAASPQDCCSKCAARSDCKAYSWSNYKSGTCWLKSGRGQVTYKPGVSSGAVGSTSSSSSCSVLENGVDYVGNDIGSVAATAASDCCAKCTQRTGCGAFSWTNFNGGTCWLKSSRGQAITLIGVYSATLVKNQTSTHIQPRIRSGEIPSISVNLGGWLVGEYWMSFTSPAWNGTNGHGWDGEYGTMQFLGREKGTAQFEQHRATWITESDIQAIAAAGMNTVRVPVGFWIVNDDSSTTANDITRVYAPGALKYLDKLINEWAVKYNLAVMLSLHAHQGSQNGYDHSAPQVLSTTSWSTSQANVDNSLQFATFLAARYKDSMAFLGMNLMNEPSYPTDYTVLLGYYKEAYRRIRATGNNCVLGVSPMLQEQGPPTMMDFMRWPDYVNVWHEFHVYYKWGYEGQNEQSILNAAKTYRSTHLDNWSGNWVFMGEWSLASPDSAPFSDRNQLKQLAAIQLEQFKGAHSGWSFWAWRHDDETKMLSQWSMRQLLQEGIFTVPAP